MRPTLNAGAINRSPGATGEQRSLSVHQHFVTIVFLVITLLTALELKALYSRHSFIADIARDERLYDEARDEALAGRVQSFANVRIFAYFLGAAALMSWLYRALGNLRRSRFARSVDSPGWAIGAFLVPIISFFKPATMMSDVSTCSGKLAQDDGGPPAVAPGPLEVWFWWIAYLAAGVSDFVGSFHWNGAAGPDDFLSASRTFVFGGGARLVAAIMVLVLTLRITALQERVRRGSHLEAVFG